MTGQRQRRRAPLIEPSLMAAIVATIPAEDVPKLIGQWATTLTKNAPIAERIRAGVRAHKPHGYFRYANGSKPAEPPLTAQRRPS
jgi:hypothetical protein